MGEEIPAPLVQKRFCNPLAKSFRNTEMETEQICYCINGRDTFKWSLV